jgi:hypothetical protein
LGRPCGTARKHWTAAKQARGGVPQWSMQKVCRRVLRSVVPTGARPARLWPLRGFMGRRGDGTLLQCHGTRPPRPACARDRLWTSGHLGAVRRGTRCGSRSKDGRREGDHDPDLVAVGSEPARTPRRHGSLSTSRGAAHTGRAPGAPAALWSATELFFSRSTRL